MSSTRLFCCVAACVLLLAATAAPSQAQDGTVKVYASTFNELAGRIQPLQLSGRYAWGCGFWGCLCDSAWTATVNQLAFNITPGQLTLTGQMTAQWCGLTFNSAISTTGNVTYSQAQNAILVAVNPTNVQPCFNILGVNVCLPASINVSSTMTLPPIPMGIAQFQIETATRTATLQMVPSNVVLVKQNGYVELRTDVTLW